MELNSFEHEKIKNSKITVRVYVCACARVLVLLTSSVNFPHLHLAGDWLEAFWWQRSTWRLLVGILCWRPASHRGDPVMHERLFNGPAKWSQDQGFIMLRGWELWSISILPKTLTLFLASIHTICPQVPGIKYDFQEASDRGEEINWGWCTLHRFLTSQDYLSNFLLWVHLTPLSDAASNPLRVKNIRQMTIFLLFWVKSCIIVQQSNVG